MIKLPAMNLQYIAGAVVVLLVSTLIIVWAIRGGNFLKPKPTPSPSQVEIPLPVISNESSSSGTSTTTAPSTSNRPAFGKSYTSSALGLTFSYPQKFNLIVLPKPATPSNPFTSLDLVFTTGKEITSGNQKVTDSSGFGVFAAPHPPGRSLQPIINEENFKLTAHGNPTATFMMISPLGNSLESARFTGGTQTLYALRTRTQVYYVIPFTTKAVLSDGSDDISTQLEQIVNTFVLSEQTSPTK